MSVRVYIAGPPYANEYRRRAVALLEAQGCVPVDPMLRDFRGREKGNEAAIVDGDVAEVESCDAVLADFTRPDEGTAMECWHAHLFGLRVVAYTGGTRPHPWVAYIASAVREDLSEAVAWLSGSTS